MTPGTIAVAIAACSALSFAQEPPIGLWDVQIADVPAVRAAQPALEAAGVKGLQLMILPQSTPPVSIDGGTRAIVVQRSAEGVQFELSTFTFVGHLREARLVGEIAVGDQTLSWSATFASSLWVCGNAEHIPRHVVPTALVERYTRESGCGRWHKVQSVADLPVTVKPPQDTPTINEP